MRKKDRKDPPATEPLKILSPDLLREVGALDCPDTDQVRKLKDFFNIPKDKPCSYDLITALAIRYGAIPAAMKGNIAPLTLLIDKDQPRGGAQQASSALAPTKSGELSKKQQVELFLYTLEETGSVVQAVAVSGMKRRTVYDMRDSNETFAKAWAEARAKGKEWRNELIDESYYQRGFEGVLEPIYQSGRRVMNPDGTPASRRVYDTTAAIFLSKAEDSKYKDSADPNANKGNIDITLAWQISTPGGETVAAAVKVSA